MAGSEVNVAIVALVVALIALLVTVSQLLGQLFATAEGTRKCSRSVIGHWSTLTTWKWHWSEWRFETIFASPQLYLGVPFEYGPKGIKSAFESSTQCTQLPMNDLELKRPSWELLGMDDNALEPFPGTTQFEGWIALLAALHGSTSKHHARSALRRYKKLDNVSWPGIRLRYRSWDSMPTDVIGPIATTTLGDIAVIARRMGMSWKTFDPDKGLLTAEGCGHSLSSVEVRALGLTLRYLTGHSHRPIENLAGITGLKKLKGIGSDRSHIWSRDADMFMFGILPGDKALNLPNFQINTDEDIRRVMYDVLQLKEYNDAPDWNLFFPKRAWFLRYEINELRVFICPILRPRGSTSNLLSCPQYGASIFTFRVARTCFKEFVTERLKTKHSQYLEGLLFSLSDSFPARPKNMSNLDWLELHQDGHDLTTKYFQKLTKKYEKQSFLWDLLRAHFSKAPLCSWEARQKVRVRKEKPRNQEVLNDGGQPWRYEQVTMLWESIPHYVAFMQDANTAYKDKDEIEEAWITLWFRGICWATCHELENTSDSEPFLPTQWYGSQLPVYLL